MKNIVIKRISRLGLSLFLVLGGAGDGLALQVMYPHIAKEVKQDLAEQLKPEIEDIISAIGPVESRAIRNIIPAENQTSISSHSLSNNTEVKKLEMDAELYYEAKRLEEEMLSELSSEPAGGQKFKQPKVVVNTEARRVARVTKIAKTKEKIKRDKELAREARYAKKESKYIFDPRRFMLGPLGERTGLGHTYAEEKRPGLERNYQESDGFRLARMFDWIDGIDSIDLIGVAGRVELAEEPFPLEALILDAKKIDVIRFGQWETREQYRSQVLPLFTKSTAIDAYLTYGNLPKFTFTYDYREIYHQYQALYGFKDWDIKTFEFRLEDSRKWYPIGYVTLMPGFKYQIYDSEGARSGNWSSANEHRDWYYFDFLWSPSGTLEFYGKIDAFKTNFHDIGWKYSPWHWGVRGEARKKYLPWQLSATLGYAHSFDKYSPFENFFRKDEVYLDLGKDITGRIKASSRWEWIYAELTEDDNMAPTYTTFNQYQADAKVLNSKNKLQYELFKNIFLTGGIDHSWGFGFNNFNNFGLYTEIEYYNAGYLRTSFGYRYTRYYILGDEVNCIYFRCFLFM